MGTYTTNYNLFMPTVGEQGWGTLVNENFSTIDTTMAELNTRLTAVENEVNGDLSCTSLTTSGTITSTGLITANGGIDTEALTTTSISNNGTITSTGLITAIGGIDGNLTGFLFVKGTIETVGDVVYATSAAQSLSSSDRSGSVVVNPYVISFPDVYEIVSGVAYCRKSDVTGNEADYLKTVSFYNGTGASLTLRYSSPSTSSTTVSIGNNKTSTFSWKAGETYTYSYTGGSYVGNYTISIAAKSVYVKFARP